MKKEIYNMYNYLEEINTTWNTPTTSSPTLGIDVSMLIPKYRGGCSGVIPYNGSYILFGEDDDHYFETTVLDKEQFKIFSDIVIDVSDHIEVVIDYVNCCSTSTYLKGSKEEFFATDFSVGDFKVNIVDRGLTTAPLITIANFRISLDDVYDISHYLEKAKYIKQLMLDGE